VLTLRENEPTLKANVLDNIAVVLTLNANSGSGAAGSGKRPFVRTPTQNGVPFETRASGGSEIRFVKTEFAFSPRAEYSELDTSRRRRNE
jgi:hypothetical protein